MALINCPECGKSISDMAKLCPHCGYAQNVVNEKQTMKKGLSTKKIIIFSVAILIVLGFVISVCFGDSDYKRAEKLVYKDYPTAEITSCWYNSEQNVYMLEIKVGNYKDRATILDGEIGYLSRFEELCDITERASSDAEKQKAAKNALAYPYDATLIYNAFMNGLSETDGWKQLK